MCFIIHPKHPTAKIAKKDIVCYKLMIDKSSLVSLAQKYPYTLNKLNDKITLKTKKEDYYNHFSGFYYIESGYHSYSSLRYVKAYQKWYDKHEPSPIHTYIIHTYICIIPKGEQYYFNPNTHQYVSTNIIIKEKL